MSNLVSTLPRLTGASSMKNYKRCNDTFLIPYKDLAVDPRYQRGLTLAHLKSMEDNWDERFVGVLSVVQRSNGTLVVIDGQHRTAAALNLGKGRELVRCQVITDLDNEQIEALMFEMLNRQAKVDGHSIYKSEVFRDQPEAEAIEATLRSFGLKAGRAQVAGTLKAIETVKGIFAKDPDLLTQTLRVIVSALGTEPESLQQNIIKGVSAFLGRYRGMRSFDEGQLISRLKEAGSADFLLGQAKAMYLAAGRGSKASFIAEILLRLYNARRMQKTRLPAWA